MDDRSALFANVLNDPADDTARLVLADWLEEHDESDLGQFICAGVIASRFRDDPLIEDLAYFDALATIAGIASWGAPARWLSERGIGPSPLTSSDWLWDNTGDRVTVRIGRVSGDPVRGLRSGFLPPLGEKCATMSRQGRWDVAGMVPQLAWPSTDLFSLATLTS